MKNTPCFLVLFAMWKKVRPTYNVISGSCLARSAWYMSRHKERVYYFYNRNKYIYLIYHFVNSEFTFFPSLCDAALKSPMVFDNFNYLWYHNADSILADFVFLPWK